MPVDPRILDTPFGHIVAVVVPLVINLGHVAAIVALCLTLLLTIQGRWLRPGRARDRVTWYRRRMTEAALVLTGVAVLERMGMSSIAREREATPSSRAIRPAITPTRSRYTGWCSSSASIPAARATV